MDSLKLVAVASSEEVRAALLKQLQGLGFVEFDGVYIELSDAVRKCQSFQPDVIVVDLTGRELDGGLFIQAIGMNPENPCVIFALHKEMDIEVFKESIRQGAREFIHYPEDTKSLETALKKHVALLQHMANQSSANAAQAVESSGEARPGQIISLFGAKGGVGTSTVAANLAHELKTTHNKSVIYFDLDQFYCNSALLLKIKPDYALGDLTGNNPKEIDAALIKRITHTHASGLDVIVGSKDILDDNDMVSTDLLEVILADLVKRYKYVVMDLPSHVLDPYHQFMVEKSDLILLISTLDIPSLSRTRQYLNLAQKYLDLNKLKLVLNRHNLKAVSGMDKVKVEEQFRYDIFARLDNNWDLNVEATSKGELLSKIDPKAELVKDLRILASLIVGDSKAKPIQEQSGQNGLLGKLFGGGKSNRPADGSSKVNALGET